MTEKNVNINKNKIIIGGRRLINGGGSNSSEDNHDSATTSPVYDYVTNGSTLNDLINNFNDETPDNASSNISNENEVSISDKSTAVASEENKSNDEGGFMFDETTVAVKDDDDQEITIETIQEAGDDQNGGFNPFLMASPSGAAKHKKKLTVDPRFDPSILNVQGGYEKVKANLDAYIKWSKNHPKESEPFTFLFTGAPGTGKTQLGRHIAEIMGRPLLTKRMSDIMSCYVGESEKNVAAAFEEASEKKAVLMIDEADSLFTSRQGAHTSWEVSLTNEVLSQMEDFEGVFICTTNLLNNFDSAAMRRFDWKVAFLPSTPEARVKLYSTYFNNNQDISDNIKNVLIDSRLNGICPGDFKAVWRKLRFIDDKKPRDILSALITELNYKQKPRS